MKNYLKILFWGCIILVAIDLFLDYGYFLKHGFLAEEVLFDIAVAALGVGGFCFINEFIYKKYFNRPFQPLYNLFLVFALSGAYALVYAAFVTKTVQSFFHDLGGSGGSEYFHNAFFLVLIAWILVVIGFGPELVKRWKRGMDENEMIRRQMLISQFELLRNQVNPNFLFNSLNTLTHIIPKDSEKAIDFVQQLSKVFRYSLQYAEENTIDLITELKVVKSYLFLNEQRFGNQLVVDLNIDETILNQHLVTQTLLMLVENAIKHNEISIERPMKISIFNVGQSGIMVENTLNPQTKPELSSQKGLPDIVERYKIVTDVPVSIERTLEKFSVKIPLLP